MLVSDFDKLPLFFEGDSRILKSLPDPNKLIGKLKPTVFSIEMNGPVVVPGIDLVRTNLNALLCDLLHENGIKTSTLATENGLIIMEKHIVPPIEVVVKGALVGSPKHIYQGIDKTPTRFNNILLGMHEPYVRFDWRNPLPLEDMCMPSGLADYFIDTKQAESTALKAFGILRNFLRTRELELIDICFFMNEEGNVICAEVSTDNSRMKYIGKDPELLHLISSKDKGAALERAQAIYNILKT